MCPINRPKFNTGSGLTPNSWGPAGERPGSAPQGIETGPPRVSRRALRELFAPGTATSAAPASGGSGGLPGDVDAATLGRPGRAAGAEAVEVVEVVATAPAAGVEVSGRPGTAAAGPGLEPAAQPPRRGHRRASRWVDVPADTARANPFTPPPDGPAATWR